VRHQVEFRLVVSWQVSDDGQEVGRSGVRCDGNIDEAVAAAVFGE
jgi:hypothetical protein